MGAFAGPVTREGRGMKAWRRFLLAAMLCAALSVTAAAASDDQGWPRVFQKDGKELTVYQPQVDFWQDYKVLHARFAIAVKTGAKKEEKYGVVETEAQTVVDQDARTVALIPKSRELRFPNTSDSEPRPLRPWPTNSTLPDRPWSCLWTASWPILIPRNSRSNRRWNSITIRPEFFSAMHRPFW